MTSTPYSNTCKGGLVARRDTRKGRHFGHCPSCGRYVRTASTGLTTPHNAIGLLSGSTTPQEG